MRRSIAVIVALLVALAAATGLYHWEKVERLKFAATLFTGAEQYQNFNRIKDLIPVTTMTASPTPYNFPNGNALTLPMSFRFRDQEVLSEEFLGDTDTSALLVFHDGALRFEEYWLTGGRRVNWLSMSVAKSFTSLAIGIAIDEGLIRSVEEPITNYVPSLKGSAYDGVCIKDILQMSSGAAWNEDYGDPESEVLRMGRILAVGGSFEDFTASIPREREPGTYNQYNSADTQVLGLLLIRATGRSITDYVQEKVWHPLGMESDAYWMVDDNNVEMAFAGLNATARDYAKLGELYRNNGNWQGRQIAPARWIKDSVTPDAPHLLPGADNPLSDFPLGYGYQWWVMDGDEGEYSAIGVYNQFIYVNPARGLVIVKLSANSAYGTGPDEDLESTDRELETIEFFRAIGNTLGDTPTRG